RGAGDGRRRAAGLVVVGNLVEVGRALTEAPVLITAEGRGVDDGVPVVAPGRERHAAEIARVLHVPVGGPLRRPGLAVVHGDGGRLGVDPDQVARQLVVHIPRRE